jgi:hypothetical protein
VIYFLDETKCQEDELKTAETELDTELLAHYCKEQVDKLPQDEVTTRFKQMARLHQALWRESKGHPIGMQPMRPESKAKPRLKAKPKPKVKPRKLGSRMDVDFALESGANFLNEDIRRAVRDRLANQQPHQTLYEDRLFADLLSSMPMCFNLFGVLQADLELADRAVHTWWPDVPGRVCAVHFEWSPGRRLEGEYLENRSAFDVAFELELPGNKRGVLGVETKYHEDCKAEKVPSDERRKRYLKVARESGVFKESAFEKIMGTDLQQIWLDHLLALSMTQHPSKKWSWAGFVLVHPARNPSYARACTNYLTHLNDTSSIRVSTLESLLAAKVLPPALSTAFTDRYLAFEKIDKLLKTNS